MKGGWGVHSGAGVENDAGMLLCKGSNAFCTPYWPGCRQGSCSRYASIPAAMQSLCSVKLSPGCHPLLITPGGWRAALYHRLLPAQHRKVEAQQPTLLLIEPYCAYRELAQLLCLSMGPSTGHTVACSCRAILRDAIACQRLLTFSRHRV